LVPKTPGSTTDGVDIAGIARPSASVVASRRIARILHRLRNRKPTLTAKPQSEVPSRMRGIVSVEE
jgi:hypothetical protein